MEKILLVEDNKSIILGLEHSLKQEGYFVKVCPNISLAKEEIENRKYDIAILDLSLPDGNGFDLFKYIKSKIDIPIIFLTADDNEINVVMGLDMGAEDYITKPFRIRELLSRIKTALRRYNKNTNSVNILEVGNIKINTQKGQVYKEDKEIDLTSLEYRILLLLFSNKGGLVKREQILEEIWDLAGNFVNDNTLSVYIKRIREKIEDEDSNIIKTVRGIGYIVERRKEK